MIVGAILLLIGAALMITGWTPAPYIYCIGALLFASMQMADRYEGDDFIVRRLRRQQLFSSLLLLVTGILMFVERHNGWIVILTIAALIQLYTAFRMLEKK